MWLANELSTDTTTASERQINVLDHPIRTLSIIDHHLLYEGGDSGVIHRFDINYTALDVVSVPRFLSTEE